MRMCCQRALIRPFGHLLLFFEREKALNDYSPRLLRNTQWERVPNGRVRGFTFSNAIALITDE